MFSDDLRLGPEGHPQFCIVPTLVATYYEFIHLERPPLKLKYVQYKHFASASWGLCPQTHWHLISMSRRLSATPGRLYKCIFKNLMTLNSEFTTYKINTQSFAATNQYEPC